jgi:hypothetical protein
MVRYVVVLRGKIYNKGNFRGGAKIEPFSFPEMATSVHCKKNLQNSCIYFYQTFQKRENPYADKGFFGALQRRNCLSFEEGKVFLSLQG